MSTSPALEPNPALAADDDSRPERELVGAASLCELLQLDLPGGPLSVACVSTTASDGFAEVWVRSAGRHGALCAVVEGIEAEWEALFRSELTRCFAAERGTPNSSLTRAMGHACRALEDRVLHRHQLAQFGATVLLLETGAIGHVYVAQLAPTQAYVLDADSLKALPEEQMWRAGRSGSEAGRRCEVEIELSRFPLQYGAAVLACSSSFATALSPSKIAEVMQQEPAAAAASLTRTKSRTAALTPAGRSAIFIRAPEAPQTPRPRLFSIDARRPAPRSMREARLRGEPAAAPPLHRAPISAWGLRRTRQPALPLLGPLWERLFEPAQVLSTGRQNTNVWLGIALALAVVVVGGYLALRAGLLGARTLAAAAGQHAGREAAILPEPPPPPLAGRTTLTAAQASFVSLAVVSSASGPIPEVLDSASQLWTPGSDPAGTGTGPSPFSLATSLPTERAGPTSTGKSALLARDAELLLLAPGNALRRVDAGAAVPLPVRAAPWRQPIAAVAYAGNLYVLATSDTGAANIWRVGGTSAGGYDSDPQSWLDPAVTTLLTGATGFSVDGDIWVSRADGAVLRFASGKQVPYQIAGMERPLQQVGAIYTERGFHSLYLVDTAARRLIQLGKDGHFEREIADVLLPTEQLRGLWADEAGKRALVLSDRRLQEVPLS